MPDPKPKKPGAKSRTIKRKYRLPDYRVPFQATFMHDTLANELALFTAKFPFIDGAWLISFKADIDSASHLLDGDYDKNEIGVDMEEEKRLLASARLALSILNNYAIIAYRTKATSRRIFGQDSWRKAFASAVLMTSALKLAHNMANQNPYNTDLTNKGMQQADIDALLTIAGELEAQSEVKKKTKVTRPANTDVRIAAYNKVYEGMVEIKSCALLVHRDSYAKKNLYRLYPPRKKKKKKKIVASPKE